MCAMNAMEASVSLCVCVCLRWRTKAVYGLVAVYGLRLAGRVLARIKENMLSNW